MMNWKNKKSLHIAGLLIAPAITMLLAQPFTVLPAYADEDKFGIDKIYPTKDNGRTWYMEQDEDDLFDDVFKLLISEDVDETSDGVFKIDVTGKAMNHGVRFHVTTPDDEKEWRDVEMTGYFKLLDSSRNEDFSLIARGGRHSDDTKCDATGYFGKVGYDGDVAFQKKLFHGNYANSIEKHNDEVSDLEDRWIGIKMIAYNVNDNDDVQLELWVDNGNEDNDWEKVAEYVDDGYWDAEDGGGCDRDRDEVLNDKRPWVSFRADNAEFLFKNLSVREINP
jgi:hypothetical protein